MRHLLPILVFLPLPLLADAPADGSAWQQATMDDESGYGEVAVLYQAAGNSIKDESASADVTPRLEIRCSPGDPSLTARIDWQRFISSFSTELGFKVDDGRFTWLKWKTDSSEQVTLSPSAEDTATLIRLMGSGSRLTVEVTPYSEGPVEVGFDLTGFDEALLALQDACR
jgi:hypothetical protein